jgi:hypothetical protein
LNAISISKDCQADGPIPVAPTDQSTLPTALTLAIQIVRGMNFGSAADAERPLRRELGIAELTLKSTEFSVPTLIQRKFLSGGQSSSMRSRFNCGVLLCVRGVTDELTCRTRVPAPKPISRHLRF